jgi:hypothetical protein
MTVDVGDALTRIAINRRTRWALHLRNGKSLRA